MKNTRSTFCGGLLFLLFSLLFVSSCTKDDELTPSELDQKWSSEVFSNMKSIYLWNDALPSTLDQTQYTTAETTLEYLTGLKLNPETGQPIDHYSFLDKIGKLSGEINQGTSSGDYGFMVTAAYNEIEQVSFYVTYVYKNSPAGRAGVARSFEIVNINGSDSVHPQVSIDGYLVTSSPGYINVVNALFNSSSARFGFKKPDGAILTTSLTTGSYAINSILYDSVFTVGSKKVGYMVFNQFLGASSQTELQHTIGSFQTSGVTDLIVDLRYNGGGSVETCEKLSSMLAPSYANGNTMYTNVLNNELTQYFISQNENLTVDFIKTNTFEPRAIYFIVSGSTASASELLINNLRPYYPGKLFLIGQTTYGKPCGFWSTPIGYTENQKTTKKGYDLYAVSFETVNADYEGGYYTGMTPGTSRYPGVYADDSFWLPWGDLNDDCIAQAVYHMQASAFWSNSVRKRVKSLKSTPVSTINRQFKGMIDFRKLSQASR